MPLCGSQDWQLLRDRDDLPYKLFNLKNAPYEKNDLAQKLPKKFAELKKLLLNHMAKAKNGGLKKVLINF